MKGIRVGTLGVFFRDQKFTDAVPAGAFLLYGLETQPGALDLEFQALDLASLGIAGVDGAAQGVEKDQAAMQHQSSDQNAANKEGEAGGGKVER